MAKRAAPEVNAGSMADIAFLLLIFFLVTTTIEVDSGITSKLPPEQPEEIQPEVRKKNVFQVIVNSDNQLLVQDDVVEVKDLSEMAQKFLDNGGSTEPGKICNYCQGDRDPESSENPQKAVISLFNDRLATYNMYATVLNELVKAYNVLRDREAMSRYGEAYTSMVKRAGDWPKEDREEPEYFELQEKIAKIADLYPRNLSEGEPTKN
jgi:biopolymer transport protein ExbD